MLALIGGSGFTGNDVIEEAEDIEMTTPWGAPSAPARLRETRRDADRFFAPPWRKA